MLETGDVFIGGENFVYQFDNMDTFVVVPSDGDAVCVPIDGIKGGGVSFVLGLDIL